MIILYILYYLPAHVESKNGIARIRYELREHSHSTKISHIGPTH
jgi:hypothetical protein